MAKIGVVYELRTDAGAPGYVVAGSVRLIDGALVGDPAGDPLVGYVLERPLKRADGSALTATGDPPAFLAALPAAYDGIALRVGLEEEPEPADVAARLIPLAVVRAACPPCADKLQALGVRGLKLAGLVAFLGGPPGAKAMGEMPEAMLEGLCAAIGRDPEGFFGRCLEHGFGDFEPDDKQAWCARLHKECTGKYPAERGAAVPVEVAKTATVDEATLRRALREAVQAAGDNGR